MSQLVERKGFKIESTLPKKKKNKEKKIKPVEQVKIIDDDAPIPWNSKKSSAVAADDELASFEDAPVVVGIIDERPKEIREKERFTDPKRWRTTAFEEVPPPEAMGPHPKPSKSSSSRRERTSSDDSDPDVSRRRPKSEDDPDLSPPRRRPQHRRDQSDDDPSPPRRRKNQSDNDPSPPRRRRNQSDDDPSPPRKRDQSSSRSRHEDPSPPRRKIKDEPDASPPRRKHKHRDDDRSPPRSRDRSSPSRTKDYRKDDRSRIKDEPQTPQIDHRPSSKRRESSPPRNERRTKDERPTSSQTAPAKSERRRLAEHKEEIAERYAAWGRGLAQVRQTEEAVKDYIEQSQKPLARYRDDQDLDVLLKTREREDDPMLKYLTPKPSEQGDRTGNAGGNAAPKPRYRGPDPQKNRFDIWPGYRWDGVDRSNGYERRLFESIANRHAKAQEAYLWSVEDM